MKSWKTTVCGIVIAAAGGVAAASGLDPVVTKVAAVVASIATGLLGIFARDNNKTSEQVGATTEQPK
jgi:hypothetical protein